MSDAFRRTAGREPERIVLTELRLIAAPQRNATQSLTPQRKASNTTQQRTQALQATAGCPFQPRYLHGTKDSCTHRFTRSQMLFSVDADGGQAARLSSNIETVAEAAIACRAVSFRSVPFACSIRADTAATGSDQGE